MAYFSNAGQVQIHNSKLFDVAGNFIMNQSSNEELIIQQGIHALEKNSAIDAMHNSQQRFPPPKCHPETRKIILAHIIAWIEERAHSLSDEKRILWLYGPAGAGKSAIAQTIAENFPEHMPNIAASFFFTRGKDRRGTVAYFISTIAYQMTVSIPEVRGDIGKAVAHNPAILHLSLEVQIQRLIVEPFHSFLSRIRPQALPHRRYLVIIDGLDECNGDANQKLIISHVANLLHNHNLPLTFLIASRPEPQIAEYFRKDLRLAAITTEFKLEPSDEDIRTFFLNSFDKIRNSHPSLASVQGPWPLETDIDILVYQSSGYFIYASTVIRFVDDKDMRPAASLELALSAASSPFSGLDALYTQILSTVPQKHIPYLMSILEMSTADNYQRSLSDFELLLQLQPGDIHIILRRLHSLLAVTDGMIYPHHASFSDYLENKERSGIFYADRYLGHAKFVKIIVKLLKTGKNIPHHLLGLSCNICQASHLLNDDTQFLEDLQAISIGSWKAVAMCNDGFKPVLRILDQWIDAFERLHPPPANIIQRFINVLHAARIRTIDSGEFVPLPRSGDQIHERAYKISETLNISQKYMPYVFEECPLQLESHVVHSRPQKHLRDPILGHTLLVTLYLKGLISKYSPSNLEYAKKWWTFHLAECSPHPPHSDEIIYLLETPGWLRAICDIDGSNRVIGWLKQVPDVPEDLVSRWEAYQKSLVIYSSPSPDFPSESNEDFPTG